MNFSVSYLQFNELAQTGHLVNDSEMNRMALRQRLHESETARTHLECNFEELNKARHEPDTAAMPAAEAGGTWCEQTLRSREIHSQR
jgi:hypothetical protein